MKKAPKLNTLMTPFPYSIERDAPLDDALRLMAEHDVRHLPVTDNHQLVGVITDRDVKGVAPVQDALERGDGLRVCDVYMPDPYVVDINEPLDNVLLEMAAQHIGSAVVTRSGRLAGMFTAVDACRSYGEFLREHFPRGGDDLVA